MRQPGVEPGSTAWEAAMITVTPLAHTHQFYGKISIFKVLKHYLNGYSPFFSKLSFNSQSSNT